MSKTVTVDIVADLVCPWCWLGKKNWEAALKQVPEIKVETLWRPYQLDPTLPVEGRPYGEYMKAKFSGEHSDRWKQMRDHLEAAAPAAGIDFRFDDIKIRPNTINAHRLIRWATGQNLASEMVETLYRAFFADCRDIGDSETLAELAGQVGLDSDLVRELLPTERDKQDVWNEEMFFRKLGVSAVPCYIYEGQLSVSGAETPEVLADGIRQASQLPPKKDETA